MLLDFGESDPTLSAKIMVEYVKLVRKWGAGVPVCIDSSDDNVLIAGLKEWYDTDLPVSPNADCANARPCRPRHR